MLATHIPLDSIRAMSHRDVENIRLYLAVKNAKDSGNSLEFDDDGSLLMSSRGAP